jgi:hypothetical protein
MEDIKNVELTILMPCLNEAETLAICIQKAQGFLDQSNISGEILIADNGSTDGSIDIALANRARVEHVSSRGYGAALIGGISSARGKYIIMGDADDSYDFSELMSYVDRLREGDDLVMGNRFKGGIEPGAMPFLHKYLGNPVLSWLGRLFFKIPVGDFHCGLRGFNADRIRELNLHTTGMEFASEMVVKSALSNLTICEVPTTLRPDGRTRAPHLRTWRDGWRHLVFLLMFSPKWLFLYPGLTLVLLGMIGAVGLLKGGVVVGGIGLDIHTFAVACVAIIIGMQSVSFAVIARRYCTTRKLIPQSEQFHGILNALTLERVLLFAGTMAIVGISGVIWCFAQWASIGFGGLDYSSLLRLLILSLTATAIGTQLALTAFISTIIEIPTNTFCSTTRETV